MDQNTTRHLAKALKKHTKHVDKAEKFNWSVICLPPSGVSKISPHLSPQAETLMAFFLQSGGVCGLGMSSPWIARSQQWRENTAFSQDRRGEGWGQLAGWQERLRKGRENDTVLCLQNFIFIIWTTFLKSCPSTWIFLFLFYSYYSYFVAVCVAGYLSYHQLIRRFL